MAPSEIEPFLIIGSKRDATDWEVLSGLAVTHIINATPDCPCLFQHDVAYLRLAIRVSCHCEKFDRPILDLQVSSYLRSVIEDDYRAGNNIHIFDLEFRNEYQLEKEFSVQGMSPSLTDNLDKIKKPELTEKIRFKSGYNEALWVAKIISHRSLHLDEYVKIIKSDPVWREGLKSYFDPYLHDHVKKNYGLGNYLDRYREQCDVPF